MKNSDFQRFLSVKRQFEDTFTQLNISIIISYTKLNNITNLDEIPYTIATRNYNNSYLLMPGQ